MGWMPPRYPGAATLEGLRASMRKWNKHDAFEAIGHSRRFFCDACAKLPKSGAGTCHGSKDDWLAVPFGGFLMHDPSPPAQAKQLVELTADALAALSEDSASFFLASGIHSSASSWVHVGRGSGASPGGED